MRLTSLLHKLFFKTKCGFHPNVKTTSILRKETQETKSILIHDLYS